MQKVILIGHIGQDAVIKDVNGNRFISFSVADSYKSKNVDGTVVEHTQWVDCSMQESGVAQYLRRGQQVAVVGRMSANAYISKQDGQPRASLNMRVLELHLLGSAQQSDSAQPSNTVPDTQAPQRSAIPPVNAATARQNPPKQEDDLPF